jgi:CRISPR-associated protein (TIGR02584 family)
METIQQQPIDPSAFPRRVLLAVTGLSPQVVTETLYALALVQRPPFVPTEIRLITTSEGAEHARLMLLDPDDGRYLQLLREYALDASGIAFDAEHIHVVRGKDGRPLGDITTGDDNTAVADTITEHVRQLTEDGACAVHASIAGGRKTMGFYLGYALSLYGRPQDRLSHVLISQPFESDHQFYYPPARPRRLIIKDRPVHTSEAAIMLADIPFVRLRDGLPKRLQKGESSFSQTVEAAQLALEPPRLVVDLIRRRLLIAGESVEPAPTHLAFYAWMARRKKAGKHHVHWTHPDIEEEYLAEYASIVGEWSGDYERAERTLGDGVTKEWFEQHKSKANAVLRDALGEPLARPYLIEAKGARPRTRFGLALDPEAIRFTATRERSEDD